MLKGESLLEVGASQLAEAIFARKIEAARYLVKLSSTLLNVVNFLEVFSTNPSSLAFFGF